MKTIALALTIAMLSVSAQAGTICMHTWCGHVVGHPHLSK